MIDSGKIEAAVQLLSRLPVAQEVISVDFRHQPGVTVFHYEIEYSDYTVKFDIDTGPADPTAYTGIIRNGPDLLRYFVEKAVVLESKNEELLNAFRVTFNALMDENRAMKEYIAEIERSNLNDDSE